MKKETIIITGSNSFIARKFIEINKYKYNLIKLNKKNGYSFSKKISVKNKKIDYFIHAAFIKDLKKNNYKKNYKSNIKGIINSLEFCKERNIKFIFLSSYLYGISKKIPIDENCETNPHNIYAKCKEECESLCQQYAKRYNMDIISLRIFNIYGQVNDNHYLISYILNLVKRYQVEKKTILLEDYQSKRDYLHIHDLNNLFNKIINKGFENFNLYNVGSGKSYSIRDIIKIINKFYPNIKFKFKINKANFIKDTKCNINKVKKDYNWQPLINLSKGIKISLHE